MTIKPAPDSTDAPSPPEVPQDVPFEASMWRLSAGRMLSLDRPRLIGILNVTPDSFSDGGLHATADAAVEHALSLLAEGADMIDIGGESTRPGAESVPPQEQIRRVVPVIERLCALRPDVLISTDTTSSAVAARAIEAGAAAINDVSAGLDDDAMLPLVSSTGAGLVLMHRLRRPAGDSYSDRYETPPHYRDVVAEVGAFLAQRARAATAAGCDCGSIVIDPGLGFGKTVEQNYELIARVAELVSLGFPLLGAASRKSFIGRASGVDAPAGRMMGTIAASVAQFLGGVRLFRVHDVAAHREALNVAAAIARAAG